MSASDFTTEELSVYAEQAGVKEHGPLTRNWSFPEAALQEFVVLIRAAKTAPPALTGNINIDANLLMQHDPEKSLMAVINYTHSLMSDPYNAQAFLTLRVNGDFSKIREEFPDFQFV